MGIVDDDIERVKAAVSLVDIVGQHVQLRKQGVRWVGLCPFHAEKTPSFGVNEQLGFYKCFGCNASGDVITYVRESEHLDFTGAVEWLAAKAGIQLRYTTGGEGRDRQRKQRLIDAMGAAVAWYHQRLLTSPDAGPARAYLKSRGIDGEVARRFQLGWAPDDWDALVTGVGVPEDAAVASGLAFRNKRNRLQDAFRARVLFPIFNEGGDPVALGGRVLPGSDDPAKYKNSPETPIYTKSKVLYGLNWAKSDVVTADEVVVCEGYTDVIGFHRAGITRAVATCGTALTEEHVRLMKRFAHTIVLAFDADEAGQGAAERFYEWERKYEVAVKVAHLPAGRDPGEMALTAPGALRDAVTGADSFLGFRLARVLRSRPITTPEQRARVAEVAMGMVNEHPEPNVRMIYAGQVAAHCGLPAADLVALAKRGDTRVRVETPAPRAERRETAEVVALGLLFHRWDDIAPWLVEALFADEACRSAFLALAEAHGDQIKAMELADPTGRELLGRIAVSDVAEDAEVEARNLIAVATHRELERLRVSGDPLEVAVEYAAKRVLLDRLSDPEEGPTAAEHLLLWLDRRNEERA